MRVNDAHLNRMFRIPGDTQAVAMDPRKKEEQKLNSTLSAAPRPARKLGLWQMIAATYLMVAGGPYGIEEIVGGAGYAGAFLILVITPLVWSLPTALMVSELAAAIPQEGGFYVWVQRALGRFWGFQEAWLTMMGSLFDMALYPALFVGYLNHFLPGIGEGWRGLALGLAMILVCTAWNLFGARAVGEGSVGMTGVLLAPFAALTALGFFYRGDAPALGAAARPDLLGGILIAMWNYMGWDNASTVAGEVESPQRTYPRVMFGAVLAVTISYLLPVAAARFAGIPADGWTTGGWVSIGRVLGGEALAAALVASAIIGTVGTFNALTMSLSRVPLAMAEDGMLPRVLARKMPRSDAPWVAIVICAACWAAFFPLGFLKLVILDVLLSGLSILLEFVALVMLRIREPHLPRPYRVPGGLAGCIALGAGPAALIALSVVRNADEQVGNVSALAVGAALILAGPAVYGAMQIARREVTPGVPPQ